MAVVQYLTGYRGRDEYQRQADQKEEELRFAPRPSMSSPAATHGTFGQSETTASVIKSLQV